MSEELSLAAVIGNAPLVCDSPSHPLPIKLWEPRSEAGITDTDGGVHGRTFGESRSGIQTAVSAMRNCATIRVELDLCISNSAAECRI